MYILLKYHSSRKYFNHFCFYFHRALFSIIAFLMLLGTLVDVWQQINPYPTLAITEDDTKENIAVSMLKCFSININGKSILKTEMGKGAITCLSGMRFISMAWIILGHLYMYIAPPYGVVENPKFLQDVCSFICMILYYEHVNFTKISGAKWKRGMGL